MLATKRIPVTEAVWVELSDLKAAGQTYSQLLEDMIEDRKKSSTLPGYGMDRERERVCGVPMVAFQKVINKNALQFINTLSSKSQRIVLDRSKTLAEDPFPGKVTEN